VCVLWQTGELTVECEWTLHSQAIAHRLRHDEARMLNDIMVRHMRHNAAATGVNGATDCVDDKKMAEVL